MSLGQGFLGIVLMPLAGSWLLSDLLNALFCHVIPVRVSLH